MVKIHSDQSVEALNREQAKTRTAAPTGQAFGDLLSQEVSKTGTKAVAPPPPGGLFTMNPLLGVQSTSAVDATSGTEDEVVQSVEKVLDKWSDYAEKLGNSKSSDSLKAAYGQLEAASVQTAALKEKYQDLADKSPKLKEIFQNLDTVLATEKVKFNRGDYL